MSYIKADLNGMEVYIPDDYKELDDFALAYPEHIEDNELTLEAAFSGTSYAHCFGDVIKRFNKLIGNKNDIKII